MFHSILKTSLRRSTNIRSGKYFSTTWAKGTRRLITLYSSRKVSEASDPTYTLWVHEPWNRRSVGLRLQGGENVKPTLPWFDISGNIINIRSGIATNWRLTPKDSRYIERSWSDICRCPTERVTVWTLIWPTRQSGPDHLSHSHLQVSARNRSNRMLLSMLSPLILSNRRSGMWKTIVLSRFRNSVR